MVEDDLEDEAFLCEALIEIEEHGLWCNWRSASIIPVTRLSDALDCLRQDSFDAILLNLSLPDSPVLLDSFLEVAVHASGTPIVVLMDEEDGNLANRLLREGAQDVLVKSEVECAPLARALRHAIERQRRTNALLASTLTDGLTGTLTHAGFLAAAEHYRQLSRLSRINLILSVVEIGDLRDNTPADRDLRDMLLIRAGEVLRNEFPAPAMIGRLDRRRFGLITAGLTDARVENLLSQAVSEIEDLGFSRPKKSARVSFSSADLYPQDSLEELLSDTELVLPGERCRV